MKFRKEIPKDLENKTFKSIVQGFIDHPDRYTDEDIAEAQKNLQKIEEVNQEDIRLNSIELDKHLIWLSGGALVLVTNIFLSEQLSTLRCLFFLVASFFSFGVSVMAVITSYRQALKSLTKIPKSKEASDLINEEFKNLKGEDIMKMNEEEKNIIRNRFEQHFSDFKSLVIQGQLEGQWVPFFNEVAYWGFIIGLGCLLVFGVINIF